MDITNSLSSIFALISFPSMVAGFIYFGRKLEKLDSIDRDLNQIIKPELKDLGQRVGALEVRMGVVEHSLESLKRVIYKRTS